MSFWASKPTEWQNAIGTRDWRPGARTEPAAPTRPQLPATWPREFLWLARSQTLFFWLDNMSTRRSKKRTRSGRAPVQSTTFTIGGRDASLLGSLADHGLGLCGVRGFSSG